MGERHLLRVIIIKDSNKQFSNYFKQHTVLYHSILIKILLKKNLKLLLQAFVKQNQMWYHAPRGSKKLKTVWLQRKSWKKLSLITSKRITAHMWTRHSVDMLTSWGHSVASMKNQYFLSSPIGLWQRIRPETCCLMLA